MGQVGTVASCIEQVELRGVEYPTKTGNSEKCGPQRKAFFRTAASLGKGDAEKQLGELGNTSTQGKGRNRVKASRVRLGLVGREEGY